MPRLTHDFTRIRRGREDSSGQVPFPVTQDYTRVRRASQGGESPPDLGQVSELIRNTLTKEYGIYPPNLCTAIQQDSTIIITAVNPQTGLNLQVTLKNLAADLITPSSVNPGVVPLEGSQGPG